MQRDDTPVNLRPLANARDLFESLGSPIRCGLPTCRKEPTVVLDHVFGGHWLYCTGCGWAGTPTEAATAALGVVFTKEEQESLRLRPVRLRRGQELWQRAQQADEISRDELRVILRKLGIANDPRSADWPQGIGRLFGAVPVSNLTLKKAPNFEDQGDWVVVTPSYDLPGRIAALVSFRVVENNLVETTHELFSSRPEDTIRRHDPGLVASSVCPSEGPVAVVNNAAACLAAQVRHYNRRGEFLRLVAAPNLEVGVHGRTPVACTTWAALPGRDLVACGQPWAFAAAVHSGRKASDAVLSEAERYPQGWVQNALAKAYQPQRTVTPFVPEELSEVLVGARQICYSADGVRMGSSIICTARPYIDVVYPTELGHLWYRGRIRYGLTEIPFSCSADSFHRNPVEVLQNRIARAGLGLVLGANYRPSLIVEAALRIVPARVASLPLRSGWDENSRSLVCGDFALGNDGEVDYAGGAPDDDGGRYCLPPARLCGERLDAVVTPYGGALTFWGIAAAVASCVLPTPGGPSRGGRIVVRGCHAWKAADLAVRMGARPYQFPAVETAAWAAEAKSGWPLIGTSVGRAARTKGYQRWAMRKDNRNAILCDARHAVALDEEREPAVSAERNFDRRLYLAAPVVIPAFFAWLMGWDELTKVGPGPAGVLDKMAEWVEAIGGDPRTVVQARKSPALAG